MFRLHLIVAVIASPMWFAWPAYPQSTPDRSVIHAVAFQQEPTTAAEYRRRAYARWNTEAWGHTSMKQVAADLDAALELNPRDVSALRLTVTMMVFVGGLTEASMFLGRVIQLAPEDKEALELNQAIFLTGGHERGQMNRKQWQEKHLEIMARVLNSRVAIYYGGLKHLQLTGSLPKGSAADGLLQSLETGTGAPPTIDRLPSRNDFLSVATASGVPHQAASLALSGTDANRHYLTPGIVGHVRALQTPEIYRQIERRTQGLSPLEAKVRKDNYLAQLGYRPEWLEQIHGEHIQKLMSSHQWANRWELRSGPEGTVTHTARRAAKPCSVCEGAKVIQTRCPNRQCTRGNIRVRRTDVVGTNPITGQRITQSYWVRVPCPNCRGEHIQTVTCSNCGGLGTEP